MLPVMLFNAFFTAAYSVWVVVVFLIVFLGYGVAIALGYVLRPAVKPYGKYLPFLLASAEGGMLGYALYGLIVGNQTGFATVDLGPVLKTIVLRLIIMGGLLVLANMIIFHLFPFDRELEIALMVLYALPAPFIIPIFSDVGRDGEYVSTSLSAHTLVSVILSAMIVVYGMSVLQKVKKR